MLKVSFLVTQQIWQHAEDPVMALFFLESYLLVEIETKVPSLQNW